MNKLIEKERKESSIKLIITYTNKINLTQSLYFKTIVENSFW